MECRCPQGPSLVTFAVSPGAGGGCCRAFGGGRWHLLWEHIVPAASRDQQLGFSAPPASWVLVLSPGPPQDRRAAGTEGERGAEAIRTAVWWSGVEFFTWIPVIHSAAASRCFCCSSMTQTRSSDSEGDSSAGTGGKEHP